MKSIAVLKTISVIRAAADCLSDEERQAFIDYIARNPEAGDLIQGTGGARKCGGLVVAGERVAASGRSIITTTRTLP
jgi:hypothetical protein